MPKAKAPPAPPGPVWKPAQRRLLAGSRRPHPLDPPPPPLTREEGWKALLEAERAEDEQCGPVTFENEAARNLYTPLRKTHDGQTPPTKLDPTTERLRASLLHTHPNQDDEVDRAYQALVAFWVGTEGLGFVFDVCRAPEPWSYKTSGLRRILVGPPIQHDTRGSGWGRLGYHLPRELRRLLFAMDEASFRQAHAQGIDWLRRRGAEIDEHEQPYEGAAVAYVLARDPSLAHERIRLLVGEKRYGGYGHLIASVTDVALGRAMVAGYASVLDIEGASVALDVVESLGRDAAELIQGILDRAATRKPALKPYYKGRFEAAKKLALTDPRPPTP